MDSKPFSAAVQLARLEAGMTTAKAARRADIDRVTWARIEAGLGVQEVKLFAALRSLGLDYRALLTAPRTDDTSIERTGTTGDTP